MFWAILMLCAANTWSWRALQFILSRFLACFYIISRGFVLTWRDSLTPLLGWQQKDRLRFCLEETRLGVTDKDIFHDPWFFGTFISVEVSLLYAEPCSGYCWFWDAWEATLWLFPPINRKQSHGYFFYFLASPAMGDFKFPGVQQC